MKPLEKHYKKNGYAFNLVTRIDDVAIYEQIIPEIGRIGGYEVFRVVKHPEKNINGRIIEARESTPSNEQWGVLGFSVSSISEAKARMAQLLRKDIEAKDGESLRPTGHCK